MKISIGSDRQGFQYKKRIIQELESKNHEVSDEGPYDEKYPVDYPIYGEMVGRKIAEGKADRGIVICATGTGIMIAANKVNGVRCGMGYNDEVAKLMREHNDANVIAFGQKQMDLVDVLRRIDIFLHTDFLEGYHSTRTSQIEKLERGEKIVQTPFYDM